MDDGAVIDRFFRALAEGDIAALRACVTADAVFWHCFDQVAMDCEAQMKALEGLIAALPERGVEDIRRHAIPGGFVQTHQFVARRPDGARMAWAICIIVQLRDGLIARMDEYIDRAGSFAPAEGAVATPGLSRPAV